MVQKEVRDPLTDQILFGALERGGITAQLAEILQEPEIGALDGNAQRDERIVYDVASIPLALLLARAADLEMLQRRQRIECPDERWNIGGRMKERRVLLDEHVGQLP